MKPHKNDHPKERALFVEFLKKEGKMRVFVSRFHDFSTHGPGNQLPLRRIFAAFAPAWWVKCAFFWTLCPEGKSHWQKTDKRWQKQLKAQETKERGAK